MSSPVPPSRVPPVVRDVLDEFHRAHGQDAFLWLRSESGEWALGATTSAEAREAPGEGAFDIPPGLGLDASLEVVGGTTEECEAAVRFLTAVVARALRHEGEIRLMGAELAERYEEITLLYSISEILGSVISLEEATGTILREVAEALGVQRARLWVHDPEKDELELVAAVGPPGQRGPIPIGDQASVTAAVFRGRRPIILEASDEFPRGEAAREQLTERESFLSVPVSYTPPDGVPRTIGVINLIGLNRGESFSASDRKLIGAIASQIGAAVENSRLVAESLRQERLVREMELAHDLQLKLLPTVDQFAGLAEVAARCVPAESVGGDFYHLFRLPNGRLGVVIGDVSSHGFGAALIMALTMSAVAIHASEEESPSEVVRRVHQTLANELETTEMYLTLFYGVIDPRQRRIVYTNAGHSHAFRISGAGKVDRLGATDPPLGIVDLSHYSEATASWDPGEDILFLFTDGLSDALGLGEIRGQRELVETAVRERAAPLQAILGRLFASEVAARSPADDRTAVLVRV